MLCLRFALVFALIYKISAQGSSEIFVDQGSETEPPSLNFFQDESESEYESSEESSEVQKVRNRGFAEELEIGGTGSDSNPAGISFDEDLNVSDSPENEAGNIAIGENEESGVEEGKAGIAIGAEDNESSGESSEGQKGRNRGLAEELEFDGTEIPPTGVTFKNLQGTDVPEVLSETVNIVEKKPVADVVEGAAGLNIGGKDDGENGQISIEGSDSNPAGVSLDEDLNVSDSPENEAPNIAIDENEEPVVEEGKAAIAIGAEDKGDLEEGKGALNLGGDDATTPEPKPAQQAADLPVGNIPGKEPLALAAEDSDDPESDPNSLKLGQNNEACANVNCAELETCSAGNCICDKGQNAGRNQKTNSCQVMECLCL